MQQRTVPRRICSEQEENDYLVQQPAGQQSQRGTGYGCVVGGISFSGGVGKIRGIVVGVLIFTALTYALTVLGVDTNLQFIFSGIIIIAAVTIDCFKHNLR